jgi:excinuclease ABC subunit B
LRAARNVNGTVILYAEGITASMRAAIDETNRRRAIQHAYNEEHGITPQTIQKSVEELLLTTRVADAREAAPMRGRVAERKATYADEVNLEEWAKILEQQMREAAAKLDFERAALLRDELLEVKTRLGTTSKTTAAASGPTS